MKALDLAPAGEREEFLDIGWYLLDLSAQAPDAWTLLLAHGSETRTRSRECTNRGSDFWAVVSLEFLLVERNGGLVILLRSFVIAVGLFLLGTILEAQMRDTSLTASAIGAKLPWFGAIFLAVYLALYARFASQWSYLCSVYNQIQQTEVTTPDLTNDQKAALATWKVGFVVDAWCHHLLAKPPFAGTIARWLIEDDTLLERYVKLNGKPDAEQVVDFLAASLGDDDGWVKELRNGLMPL